MTLQHPCYVIAFYIFHIMHTMIHICGQISFQLLSFLDSCERVYKSQKGKSKQILQNNLLEMFQKENFKWVPAKSCGHK